MHDVIYRVAPARPVEAAYEDPADSSVMMFSNVSICGRSLFSSSSAMELSSTALSSSADPLGVILASNKCALEEYLLVEESLESELGRLACKRYLVAPIAIVGPRPVRPPAPWPEMSGPRLPPLRRPA